jgi:hypothetical protein
MTLANFAFAFAFAFDIDIDQLEIALMTPNTVAEGCYERLRGGKGKHQYPATV